jgi:hypothetical protein
MSGELIDNLVLTFVGVAIVVGCAGLAHFFINKD